jgi:hypothetical protein
MAGPREQILIMTKRLKVLVLSGLLLGAQIAFAADERGRFWLGGASGLVPCPTFIAAMAKARTLEYGSDEFAREMQGFSTYLHGFRTGYNAASPDTCDLFAGAENDYPLLAWAENWCTSNASRRFGDAVVALSAVRFPIRDRTCAK